MPAFKFPSAEQLELNTLNLFRKITQDEKDKKIKLKKTDDERLALIGAASDRLTQLRTAFRLEGIRVSPLHSEDTARDFAKNADGKWVPAYGPAPVQILEASTASLAEELDGVYNKKSKKKWVKGTADTTINLLSERIADIDQLLKTNALQNAENAWHIRLQHEKTRLQGRLELARLKKLLLLNNSDTILAGALLTIRKLIENDYSGLYSKVTRQTPNQDPMYILINEALGITAENPMDEESQNLAITAYNDFIVRSNRHLNLMSEIRKRTDIKTSKEGMHLASTVEDGVAVKEAKDGVDYGDRLVLTPAKKIKPSVKPNVEQQKWLRTITKAKPEGIIIADVKASELTRYLHRSDNVSKNAYKNNPLRRNLESDPALKSVETRVATGPGGVTREPTPEELAGIKATKVNAKGKDTVVKTVTKSKWTGLADPTTAPMDVARDMQWVSEGSHVEFANSKGVTVKGSKQWTATKEPATRTDAAIDAVTKQEVERRKVLGQIGTLAKKHASALTQSGMFKPSALSPVKFKPVVENTEKATLKR